FCSPPGGCSETSERRWRSSEAFSERADRESDPRSRSFRGRAGRVTSSSASSMESTGPIPSMWSSSNGSKGGRHLLKGRRRLAIEVRRSIEEPERVGKLWEAMERGRANRAATIEKAGLDLPAFRDRVRSIKETAAQDPTIAEAFAEAVRTNGGRVFFADTGRGAVQPPIPRREGRRDRREHRRRGDGIHRRRDERREWPPRDERASGARRPDWPREDRPPLGGCSRPGPRACDQRDRAADDRLRIPA